MRGTARAMIVLCALAVTAPARAQGAIADCHTDPTMPLRVSPSSGASNTPLNAPVVVQYAPGYFDPLTGPGDPPASLFRLVACGTCGSVCDVTSGMQVPGLVQTQGDDLIFVPDAELLPHTMYAGRATGLDGDLPFNFCTGAGRDTMPPSTVSITSVSSTHVSGLSCLADGYRIGVNVPAATDMDGPPGSIEYLLFETRGEGIDEPTLVDRFRPSSPRITLAFLLPTAAARTPICLQVVTVDGLGHTLPPTDEHCFDPVGRTSFQGCTAGGRGGSAGLVALAIVLISLGRRRIG